VSQNDPRTAALAPLSIATRAYAIGVGIAVLGLYASQALVNDLAASIGLGTRGVSQYGDDADADRLAFHAIAVLATGVGARPLDGRLRRRGGVCLGGWRTARRTDRGTGTCIATGPLRR